MRIFIIVGFVAILGIAGTVYYFSEDKSAPPPPDVAQIILQKLRAQSAANGVAVEKKATDGTVANEFSPPPAGLAITLINDGKFLLTGRAVNASAGALALSWPTGTTFANGAGELISLKPVALAVAAGETADLSIPVARLHAAMVAPEGDFTVAAGPSEAAKPLVDFLAQAGDQTPEALQVALLVISENVSFDRVGKFPDFLPQTSKKDHPESFHFSPAEILAGLSCVKKAGYDVSTIVLLNDQELKIAAMLDPEAHDAAMELFGISSDREWSFWKYQLLRGDSPLRPAALFGIAQHYPEIALEMLPKWVRETRLARDYRYGAARALAWINDPKSLEMLLTLRNENPEDAELSQNLQQAIQDWDLRNRPKTGAAESSSPFLNDL